MGVEDILVRMMANTQEALRQWEIMKRGPEGLGDVLERTARRGKRASFDMTRQFEQMAARWVSIGAAVSAATRGIAAFRQEQARLRTERAENTVTLNEQFVGLFQQMGLTGRGQRGARDQMRSQMFNLSERYGLRDTGVAIAAAKQLKSIGFEREAIQGGGLEDFLKLIIATTATGRDVDTGQIARAMGMFIEATGQGKTRRSIRQTGVAVSSLYENTPLELKDLEALAGESGAITQLGGTSWKKQLALYAGLRETKDPATAATAFRNFVLRLAAPTPAGAKALQGLGIEPGQVDFIGEDLGAVIKLLNRKVQAAPAAARAPALREIFGQKTISGGLAIMQSISHYAQNLAAIEGGEPGFERSVAFATKGPAAEAHAANIRRQRVRTRPDAARSVRIGEDVRTALEDAGASGLGVAVGAATYNLLVSLGVPPEVAARLSTPITKGDAPIPGFGGGLVPRRGGSAVMDPVNPTVPSRSLIDIELHDPDRNAIPATIDAAQLAPH